jgi:hypothetical protein
VTGRRRGQTPPGGQRGPDGYGTFVPTADVDGHPGQESPDPDTQAVLAAWEGPMSSMRSEVDDLRDERRWRGGKRTLMHALGIHYLELSLTAGLTASPCAAAPPWAGTCSNSGHG